MKPQQPPSLDSLVETFATRWLGLGETSAATDLVADPILVLGPAGTAPVPRAAFLDAISSRAAAVADAPHTTTTLAGLTTLALGERMVLATIRWTFRHGESTDELVGDFLLQRDDASGLRCVAYLPRTNVMEHLA